MYERTSAPAWVALALLIAGCADSSGVMEPQAQPQEPEESVVGNFPGQWTVPLRVMSRNLYLGGDIGPILAAPEPALIPVLVAQTWATVQSTDFV